MFLEWTPAAIPVEAPVDHPKIVFVHRTRYVYTVRGYDVAETSWRSLAARRA